MKYKVYHWDTFEEPGEDTIQIGEFDYLDEAIAFVEKEYVGRITCVERTRNKGDGCELILDRRSEDNGADRVDIVSSGDVVRRFHVR